jgi:hypothetical protein
VAASKQTTLRGAVASWSNGTLCVPGRLAFAKSSGGPCIEEQGGLINLVDPEDAFEFDLDRTIERTPHLGADVTPLPLECRHSSQRVQFKLYDREELVKRMEAIEVLPSTESDE